MKLLPQQKQLLKGLIKHDGWEILLIVMSQAIDQWRNESPKGQDEFNTMWNLAFREGKVEGVKQLFDEIEKDVLT